MFSQRCRGSFRPAFECTSRCLRDQRPAVPRKSIFQQMRQQRHQSTKTFRSQFRKLWQAHPIATPAGVASILFGFGLIIYTNYFYYDYIIGQFRRYPELVAKELRKALYYTNIAPDAKLALKYYQQAVRVADELGMDPFSDEVMGIKIQVAFFLERIQLFTKAIDVLEIVKRDNLLWLDKFGNDPELQASRTRILVKTIQVSVKLGDLYANEYVKEPQVAEERLIWAVETVLKEQRRRETEGINSDDWLPAEEIGGALEALGNSYEEKDQHYLAAPLFLQALTMSPTSSCHTAVLMNNLSISLAQQDPPIVLGQPPMSRSVLIGNARAWAEKAIAVAAKITPPERTEECDTGCAVATHNLGEFAEMDGNIAEARKRYEEAKSLSRAIGFTDGVINSEKGLRRLKKT